MLLPVTLPRRRRSASHKAARRGIRPWLEALEDRCLLTLGNPAWLPQGPNTLAEITGGLASVGAVQTVAIDPTNANRIFAASVDGGIWSTINGTSSAPTWTPLTDTQPFLGTTDIEFDPTDATRNTLWAGTGRFSNNGIQNGPTVGLYKTVNGGAGWSVVGQTTFQGLNVSAVIPTTLKDPATGKQVILVSTQATPFAGGNNYATPGPAGVYRSADGGLNWALVSGGTQANGSPTGLPAGDVWQMVGDPGNAQRFYAGVTLAGNKGGVFVTSNGGTTWSEVAGDALLTNGPFGNVSGIKLAVHNDPTANVLYAAVVNTAGDLAAVLRSTNQGAAWVRMDLPGDPVKSVNPGDQGPGNDDIVADPVSPTVVYVAGDRSFLFRGDAAQPAGANPTQQWASITDAGASATTPHADSRNMVFDPNGNLVETDDGGIYRLSTPGNPATRQWTFLSATLAATAANFVAYDPVNHVIFGGAQDNGSPNQTGLNSFQAFDTSSGDGQVAQADNVTMPGFTIRYTTAQRFGLARVVFNGANNALIPLPLASAAFPALTVGATGKSLSQLDKPPFTTQFAVDTAGGNRLLIGTRFLYESLDGGTTLTPLLGLTMDGKPKGDVGAISALAYGGRLNGQSNADVAYVGTDGSGKDVQGRLLLRKQAGGAFAPLTNYPGSTPLQIALDPDNWQTGYVLDDNGRLWRMTNAGTSPADFTDITGNLTQLGLSILRTVSVFPNTAAANDEVVFVGGYGGSGVAATDNATLGANTQWTGFGTGLPKVMVTGLVYDPTDNVLAASTYGRGFWEVPGLTNSAGRAAPTVKLSAPATAGNDFTTTFMAGGLAVAVTDPGVRLTAPASATLAQVTVTLTNPQDGPAEVLTANTSGTNITAVPYNPTSGQLILRGSDTPANYQKVLATLTYRDTAAPPANTMRAINIVATDGVASGRATSSIQIVGGAAVPTVTAGNGVGTGAVTTSRSTVPTNIGTTVQIHSPSPVLLAGATVTIVNPLDAPNEFLDVDTTGTNITANYDPETGVLTLAGTDSEAHYQQALDSLTYDNTAEEPASQPRQIRIVLDDGIAQSLAGILTVDIEPTNHAPVLNPSAAFTADPINEGDPSNPGTFVFDLLQSAVPGDAVSDPDPGSDIGIAVVGVDNRHGNWQFSTDGGATWDAFQDLSTTRAILLTADDATLVRFLPAPGFAGAVPDGLTFRAWDQTSGQPQSVQADPEIDGTAADTSTNGGSTPFSSATAQAGITVNAVNQPPSFQVGPNLVVGAAAGPQTVPGWATQIVPGGLHGSGAAVTFQVTDNNNGFFLAQPVLSPDGTLTFTPSPASSGGFALVTVVAHNNAGTANGGRDSSAPQVFLITVTPASSPGDADRQWLAGVYRDLFQRSLDAAGQAFWGNRLAQGVGRVQVALALEQSPEFQTVQVQGFYQRLLGRSADGTGLTGWQQALAAGAALTDVEAGILGSIEYRQRHDGTTPGYLSALYQDVLGRSLDATGLSSWGTALAQGTTAALVAQAVLHSPEAQTAAVQSLYTSLLHRPADPTGLSGALSELTNGVSLETVRALVLGSGEYFGEQTGG